MALDKNTLGEAIYSARSVFNNLTNAQLIAAYGDLETAREAICVAEADAIITHLKTAAVLSVPGTGLAVGSSPVTGVSLTGKIL